jgi:predicted transcriptional regulator
MRAMHNKTRDALAWHEHAEGRARSHGSAPTVVDEGTQKRPQKVTPVRYDRPDPGEEAVMTTRIDELERRFHDQMRRDRRVVMAEVQGALADYAERRATWTDCCKEAWLAFADWVRELPLDDERFTILASFGVGIGGRGWAEILRDYIDGHVGNDSFGLTAPNAFPFCERPGHPRDYFDQFFDLFLLDAVASALYEASSVGQVEL